MPNYKWRIKKKQQYGVNMRVATGGNQPYDKWKPRKTKRRKKKKPPAPHPLNPQRKRGKKNNKKYNPLNPSFFGNQNQAWERTKTVTKAGTLLWFLSTFGKLL